METVKVYDFFSRIIDPGKDFKGSKRITQQEFAGEVNINKIIERAERTKQDIRIADYNFNDELKDFSSLDYRDSINIVERAREDFMSLPAKVRVKFQNDPGRLLDFVRDERNMEEMYEIGLMSKEATERWKAAKFAAKGQTSAST